MLDFFKKLTDKDALEFYKDKLKPYIYDSLRLIGFLF